MISKREVVVVLNGAMIGMTRSMLDSIFFMSRDFMQRQIHLFVHTWDYEYNNLWVEEIKEYVKKKNQHREIMVLHLTQEKYNNPKVFAYLKNFQTQLGIKNREVNGVSGHVSKRIFYFYTLVKCMQEIKEYNPDAYVIRMVPNHTINTGYTPFAPGLDSICKILIDFFYSYYPKHALPNKLDVDFQDMLLSETVTNDTYSERFWATSLSTLIKIYSLDEKEISRRVSNVINSFKDVSLEKQELTLKQLDYFLLDRFSIPIEGGMIIKKIVDEYYPDVTVHSMPIGYIAKFIGGMINPWVWIEKDKVVEIVKCKLAFLKDTTDYLVKVPPHKDK